MNWRTVRCIWQRELRDQLRDQRTLFMVAILPVLMYPLLGTSFFQLAQFMRQHTATVVVAGAEQLDRLAEADSELPRLLEGERFAPGLFDTPTGPERLVVRRIDAAGVTDPERGSAQDLLARGKIDAIVVFPDGFAEELGALRKRLAESRENGEPTRGVAASAPQPLLLYNAAREPSQVAQLRLDRILSRWRQQVVRANLEAIRAPDVATQPFGLARQDIAPKESRDARLWSKLLPFIVFVWALTGAFYPAIDLCPGEKERGTLETLLASPARRSEIVIGKLLTVMTFSVFTAVLNLLSLALTARMVVGQLASMGPLSSIPLAAPTLASMIWLLVALIPIAAMFSALSLAFAAYARSTKEGQYYFMPLFLVAMPLMLLPMAPGVELHFGNAMVPIMGLALLLRAMIEGQISQVLPYAIPAIGVTAICCWLAIRWAITQFNQESVLFREGERLSVKGWIASTIRRREATPSAAAAVACVAAIFLVQFGLRQTLALFPPSELTFGYFAMSTLLSQIVCILAPALVITWLLARDWRKTLLMERPWRLGPIALGALMAAALHPIGHRMAGWIQTLYPPAPELLEELAGLQGVLTGSPLVVILLLMAVLPAVCEEIAFRGVLLGGLRKPLGGGGAVLVSAALFGATHTILQQSLAAAPIGVVLGILALRTGSLPACITFHAVYNALQLLFAEFGDTLTEAAADSGVFRVLFAEIGPGELGYSPEIAILGAVVALALVRVMTGRGGDHPPSPARSATAS